MPDRFQESHIKQVPLFQPLSQAQIEILAQSFQVRRYNPGEVIFQQNDPTRGMHIFVEGQAVLLRTTSEGNRQSVGVIREGQYINQNALFQEGRETATLQAVQPVTALFLSRESMANVLAYHADIAETMGLKAGGEHHLGTVRFKTQRPNEHVVLMTRRHWWAYIRWLWVPLLLVPFIALIYALPMFSVAWVPLLFVIPGIVAVYLYFEWANDSVIITDQRVIRITHTILTFSEVRNEVALSSIQEANADLPRFDPFALILGYGNVELKTAGREGNFMLDFMPDPEGIQELILEDLRTQNLRVKVRERQALRADLDKWLGEPQTQGQQLTNVQTGGDPATNIEKVFKIGDGPLSPFVTRFRTEGGGTAYRTHWLFWFTKIMRPLFWLLIAGVAAIAVFTLPVMEGFQLAGGVGVFVMFLIGAVWLFLADWDWRHDYYIVSDDYITILSRRPLLLQYEDDQLLLRQVDNVVAETRGLLQQIFGYGDVRVALVGADEHHLFDNVAKPQEIQNEISRRQALIKQREAEEQERQQRKVIGEYFSLYHDQYGYPVQQGQGYPPQQGQGYPPQQGQGYPPQQGQGYPPQQGQGYPPQQGYPAQQGQGYPPQQGYPAQQGQGYPPQQGQGYPPQQGQGYPPQQPPAAANPSLQARDGRPQQPAARPSMSSGRPYQPSVSPPSPYASYQGRPPQQQQRPQGYPPQQPGRGYPPQQQGQGYPPQQPGRPQGYPPQQGQGYPAQQPGRPQGYPSQQQQGYPPQPPNPNLPPLPNQPQPPVPRASTQPPSPPTADDSDRPPKFPRSRPNS